MTEQNDPRAQDLMNIDDTVILRDIPVGTRLRLRGGVLAEVTANPQDGAWVFIRYLKVPGDPAKAETEDMVFCTEVTGVLCAEPGDHRDDTDSC